MSVTKLLIELLQSGMQLWVEDDELCYRASQAALTPARREQLSERKSEIVALLAEENTKYSSPSFAQQRLWLLQQLEPDDTSYNMRQAIRMKGALDVGALRKALGTIVARQEALRTTFAVLDGSPVQVIAPALDVPLPVEDLGGPPGAEREEAVRRRANEEKRRPFDRPRSASMLC
jgi:Condensation domain/TubC N-terminal docking domain